MIKKILLILSILVLCSCQTNNDLTKTTEALYDIEDITFTLVDYSVTIDNHNDTYLIEFSYKLSNTANQIEDSIILRPNESYITTLDFMPNEYSNSDLTYYKFNYSINYDLVYETNYVLVFLDEDNFELVNTIMKDEIRLAKIVSRYNHTYKFSYGYYAYYNEENNSYDVYYKDTYIKSLSL